MAEKTRYTDAELDEFRKLIIEKLDKAQKDYELLRNGITNLDGNDVMDTSPTFKVLEEGSCNIVKRGIRSTGTASNEIHSTSSGGFGSN